MRDYNVVTIYANTGMPIAKYDECLKYAVLLLNKSHDILKEIAVCSAYNEIPDENIERLSDHCEILEEFFSRCEKQTHPLFEMMYSCIISETDVHNKLKSLVMMAKQANVTIGNITLAGIVNTQILDGLKVIVLHILDVFSLLVMEEFKVDNSYQELQEELINTSITQSQNGQDLEATLKSNNVNDDLIQRVLKYTPEELVVGESTIVSLHPSVYNSYIFESGSEADLIENFIFYIKNIYDKYHNFIPSFDTPEALMDYIYTEASANGLEAYVDYLTKQQVVDIGDGLVDPLEILNIIMLRELTGISVGNTTKETPQAETKVDKKVSDMDAF